MLRLLFIGDIVGQPGRELRGTGLAGSSSITSVDFVIANAENAAAGFGITREIGDQLLDCGVDVMTSGNHIWDKKEALDYIGAEPRLLRPANYPAGAPGNGSYLARTRDRRDGRRRQRDGPRVHAQHRRSVRRRAGARSNAMRERTRDHLRRLPRRGDVGKDRDGLASRRQRVTAVVGTHTHVQTADERILPKGTAYLTDVGMTGPHDSIIGVEIEAALGRFLTALPSKFETATGNPAPERGDHRGRRADRARDRYRACSAYSVDELGDAFQMSDLLRSAV